MLDGARIRAQIDRDVFDYQQLTNCLRRYSKPRDKISRLLSRGELIRIKKGLYTFGEPYRRGPISRGLLANLIYGPSYVSLEYALSYHGLVPERVEMVTSVTTGRSREYETPFGTFSYRRLSRNRYAIGAMLERTGEVSFLIASPEKALADKVWVDKRFHGTSLLDYGTFLQEDLRMDISRLASLRTERFEAIARCYESRKIRSLVRYIMSIKEQGDA